MLRLRQTGFRRSVGQNDKLRLAELRYRLSGQSAHTAIADVWHSPRRLCRMAVGNKGQRRRRSGGGWMPHSALAGTIARRELWASGLRWLGLRRVELPAMRQTELQPLRAMRFSLSHRQGSHRRWPCGRASKKRVELCCELRRKNWKNRQNRNIRQTYTKSSKV